MKRYGFWFMAALAALTVGMISGCGPTLTPGLEGPDPGETEEPATPLEIVEEKYAKLAEAEKVEQSIDIARGALVQYESERTYEKKGGGYTVKGSEKRLMPLTEGGSAYEETAIESTVKAGEFGIRLDLDELYFSTAPELVEGVMEVRVADGNAEAVFGLTGLEASVKNLVLRIETDAEHVTGMRITYESQGAASTASSTVTIVLKFTY